MCEDTCQKGNESPKVIELEDFINKRDAYLKRLKLAKQAGKRLNLKDISWFV